MPFIVLIEFTPAAAKLALVKLCKDLFQVDLRVASERIGSLFYHDNRLLEVDDWVQAAHFVYQARQYGAIFQLRLTAPAFDGGEPTHFR